MNDSLGKSAPGNAGSATLAGTGTGEQKGTKTLVQTGKSSAARPAAAPVVLADRYEVKGVAGQGGMGEVLIVHDRVLEREIALKRLRGDEFTEDRVRRFINEARVTGRLEHPGIVPVHDLTESGGRPCFIMKLVRGQSLAQVLDGQRGHVAEGACRTSRPTAGTPAAATPAFDLRRLAGVLASVCHAVAFAHARGVLHRDLKPDNIMLGDFGEVLVMDWGLARDGSAGAVADGPAATVREGTMEGSIAGTPGYMAPEQARGEISRLSERSDVYALGAVLYECLALQPPHKKEDSLLTLRAVLTEPIRPPSIVAPKRRVPKDLEAVALKALAREPADRYPTVSSMREDIEAWLADLPVSARRSSRAERFVLWARRNRERALGMFLGLGVALTGAGGYWGSLAWREAASAEARRLEAEHYLSEADQEAKELGQAQEPDTSGPDALDDMESPKPEPKAEELGAPPPSSPTPVERQAAGLRPLRGDTAGIPDAPASSDIQGHAATAEGTAELAKDQKKLAELELKAKAGLAAPGKSTGQVDVRRPASANRPDAPPDGGPPDASMVDRAQQQAGASAGRQNFAPSSPPPAPIVTGGGAPSTGAPAAAATVGTAGLLPRQKPNDEIRVERDTGADKGRGRLARRGLPAAYKFVLKRYLAVLVRAPENQRALEGAAGVLRLAEGRFGLDKSDSDLGNATSLADLAERYAPELKERCEEVRKACRQR